MRRLTHAVVVLTCLVLVPSWSSAQSSITGVVGIRREQSCPASTSKPPATCSSKRWSAVTDDTGQYRITELRPGTYTVTFTLTGFSTVKREQLELPADFVSTVNADMRVGTLEETVTVTGESPIVDVQSARRRRTLDENLIESLPRRRDACGGHGLDAVDGSKQRRQQQCLAQPRDDCLRRARRPRQRRHRTD